MKISRRHVVGAGLAGTAALAGIPVARHVGWNMKDFTRADYSADLPETPPGETAWQNWAGNIRATPVEIAAPGSEAELAELVARADGPVRAVGSGHSWTGLVKSEGRIVDVSRLAGIRHFDPETGEVRIGAGTRLRAAARGLSEHGRAFANLPDIDVQTLAGSFSTATHGTGRDLPAIHDHAVGFRIVTASGETIEADRDNHPDLFQAGKVSLGALGIITEYRLRTVPAFNLRRRMVVEEVDTLLERFPDAVEGNRNFEFYYVPGTRLAAFIEHNLHDGPVEGRPPSEDEDTVAELRRLRDMFGWSNWLRGRLIRSAFPEPVLEDTTDESWRLLSTARLTKMHEMEYHLPVENALDAMREIFTYLDRRRDVFFPVEIRYTAADDAWLSPFNDGPRISIAVHSAVDEDYSFFFDVLEPLHLRHGGRPHWGKHHSLRHDRLSAMYPRFEDFAELRRSLDPAGKFLNAHLAGLFGEDAAGLS